MIRKALFVVIPVLAVAAAAFAGGWPNQQPLYWSEVQPSTRTIPSVNCYQFPPSGQDAGMYIRGSVSLLESVQCTNGAAVTAGSIVHYWCDPMNSQAPGPGLWEKVWPAVDYTVTTATGTFPDGGNLPSLGPVQTVVFEYGYWLAATSGVTCAGTWDGGVLISTSIGSVQ